MFTHTMWSGGGDKGAPQPGGQIELLLKPFLPSGWCVLEKEKLSPYRSVCEASGSTPTSPVTCQQEAWLQRNLVSSATREGQDRV